MVFEVDAKELRVRFFCALHDSELAARAIEASKMPHEYAQMLRQVAGQVLEDVHNLAVQLRPAVLDELGLSAALKRLAQEWQKRHQIQADVVVHLGSEHLPDAIETTLYRIIQEALTNVARHAQAKQVSVLVEQRQTDIVAVIEDDGRGFDLERVHRDGHLGLLGIRERAELLGGSLTIESSPGEGTNLFIRLSLSHLQIVGYDADGLV